MRSSMPHAQYTTLRPSARQEHDEKRFKERGSRYGLNPGPGAYEPKHLSSHREALAG